MKSAKSEIGERFMIFVVNVIISFLIKEGMKNFLIR